MKSRLRGNHQGFTAGSGDDAAATRAGTARRWKAELSGSHPALYNWLTSRMPEKYSKAYRWVAEMERNRRVRRRGPGSRSSTRAPPELLRAHRERTSIGPNRETAMLERVLRQKD